MKEVLRGFIENQAATNPGASDPRLRGRTYAIPFEDVWQASISLSRGRLRGWSLVSADDTSGAIEVLARTTVLGFEDDVRIAIGLDENAQTRVDVEVVSRNQRRDLGRTRRSIGRFLRRLDRHLAVRPDQILDPTRSPAWRVGS